MTRLVARTAAFGMVMFATTPLSAEEWTHEIAPYLWGAGLNGTSEVGNVVADIDASFIDILEDLEMGFMGAYRGSRGDFSIVVDTVYMSLGVAERGPNDRLKADIDLDQVDAGYDVLERLTVFGGLRYLDLQVKVKVDGPSGTVLRGDGEKNWVDPVIGAHYTIPIAEAWWLNLRGDIGGFGVGSDFAWQAVANLRWQTSERVGMLLAYRHMDIDYEDGKDRNYFRYDMAFSGPALGVVFTF
jgi:hypothetical protein